MDFKLYTFNELSLAQLYDIMALRVKVFIVEQQSIYPDLDGYDQDCLHICSVQKARLPAQMDVSATHNRVSGVKSDTREQVLAAYARVLAPHTKFAHASIGRMVVAPEFRRQKLAEATMRYAIAVAQKHFSQSPIYIEAQHYMASFYERLGFVASSQPYELDGIMHVDMVLPLK